MDYTVKVDQITKTYKLYKNNIDRVKEVLTPFKKQYYKEFQALQNISLTIKQGETVGIIGRNGSGKSTLLQIICGIIKPTVGNVDTKGRIAALLELGAGFNPEFTGRENVYLNAAILGVEDKIINERFENIVDFAGVGNFIDQPVKTYSSGMFIRLAFSIAVNVDPDILVIDEALSVGDAFFQSKCFSKFKEFQEKGITVLLVTHDLNAIVQFCSKAYLLENGQVYSFGNPKEVVDVYNRLVVDCTDTKIDTKKDKIICGNQTCNTPMKQLDSSDKNRFQINPDENRYGNGMAKIFNAGIYDLKGKPVQTIIHGLTYEFKLEVKFLKDLTNPVLAYTIKDLKGFDISGTNTLYKNIETGTVKKNDVMQVTFRHKNLLNKGQYLLSFGCAGFENGEYIVYDRRFDYLIFEVLSEQLGVGFIDLESTVEFQIITCHDN